MRRSTRLALAASLLLGAAALPARAVDLTVFVSSGSPGETWKRGFGGTFGLTLFRVAALEAELARQPLELGDGNLDTFTGAALLAPPIGRFVPYAGLGVGAYRRTLQGDTDTSTHTCFIVGLKVRLGMLVLKGDYRSYDHLQDPAGSLDSRLNLGAGISF